MKRIFGRERQGTPADLLVVGLANPGSEHEGTRHNVGGEVIELLAERHDAGLKHEKGQLARTAEAVIGGRRLALAIPTTYMNQSGQAVRPLVRRYGVDDPERLVVVHDELDLEPGRLKVKLGGGLAGNNGLESIRQHLHTTDFARVRLGIGKPPTKERGADHVLSRPGKAERTELDIAVQAAADAVEQMLSDGVEPAMQRVNARG